MNIIMITFVSVASVAAGLFFALRLFRWRSLIKMHWMVDIVFTVALFFLFQGTLAGTLIAVIAGLAMSIILTIGKAADRFLRAFRTAYATTN